MVRLFRKVLTKAYVAELFDTAPHTIQLATFIVLYSKFYMQLTKYLHKGD